MMRIRRIGVAVLLLGAVAPASAAAQRFPLRFDLPGSVRGEYPVFNSCKKERFETCAEDVGVFVDTALTVGQNLYFTLVGAASRQIVAVKDSTGGRWFWSREVTQPKVTRGPFMLFWSQIDLNPRDLNGELRFAVIDRATYDYERQRARHRAKHLNQTFTDFAPPFEGFSSPFVFCAPRDPRPFKPCSK